MKKRALSQTFRFGLFSAAILLASNASAEPFQHFWESHGEEEGHFRLLPKTSFYSTSANFDDASTSSDLPALGKYSSLGFDLGIAYGVAKNWTLFGNLAWAKWKAETATVESSSYGLTDQTLGIHFVAARFESGSRIELQAQAEFPAYDNAKLRSESNPDLGNQSLDLTAGGFVFFPLSLRETGGWWLTGGGGFTSRSKGYAKHALWTAGLEYRPIQEGWIAGFHGFGVNSLKNGSSPWPAGESISQSFAVGSANPSVVNIREKVGYQIHPKTALIASAHQALWGQEAPKGMAFALGAEFRFGGDEGASLGDHERELAPGDRGEPSPSRSKFIRYSSKTAKVTGMNDRLHLVRLDKGQDDGFQPGQVFDVFTVQSDGTAGEIVARGKLTSVKPGESALVITEYYREIWIQEGFLAKQPLP